MNYVIRDGNGVLKTISSVDVGEVIHPQVLPGGSTGRDFSVGAPAIPVDDANEELLIVPATPDRAEVCVQNQSTATLQIVRDDGAGGEKTSIFLVELYATWKSSSFKGRITVYGPAGSSVAAYQD